MVKVGNLIFEDLHANELIQVAKQLGIKKPKKQKRRILVRQCYEKVNILKEQQLASKIPPKRNKRKKKRRPRSKLCFFLVCLFLPARFLKKFVLLTTKFFNKSLIYQRQKAGDSKNCKLGEGI